MLSPYNVLTRWQGWGNSSLFHMGPNLIPVDSTLMTYSTSQRSHLRVPSLLGVWISTYEFWVDTNLLPKHSTPPCNFNITDVLHMNLCTACTFVLQTQRRGWYLWSLSLRTVFYPLESLESRPGASRPGHTWQRSSNAWWGISWEWIRGGGKEAKLVGQVRTFGIEFKVQI